MAREPRDAELCDGKAVLSVGCRMSIVGKSHDCTVGLLNVSMTVVHLM